MPGRATWERSRSKRVVLITTSYPRETGDPSGHFVEAEARAWQARGASVTVLAGGSGAPLGDGNISVRFVGGGELFGWPGIVENLRRRPRRALHGLDFARGVRRELGALGPVDRIVAHWLVPSLWPLVTLFAARTGSPVIEGVAHGSDVRLLQRLPGPLRRLIWRALARADHLRFVSAELLQRVTEDPVLPASLRREIVTRSRIEPASIELPGLPSKQAARGALGVRPSERLLIVGGRLVDSKRIPTALTAASLVPKSRVVVLGDGPALPTLAETFPDAHFLGRLDRGEALTWLVAADLLISASRLEGAPTLIREARLLGVPVVSTQAGDLDQWSESDDGIWLVD